MTLMQAGLLLPMAAAEYEAYQFSFKKMKEAADLYDVLRNKILSLIHILNSGIDVQFCVMKSCENKEAAYEVLRFLYRDDTIRTYLSAVSYTHLDVYKRQVPA